MAMSFDQAKTANTMLKRFSKSDIAISICKEASELLEAEMIDYEDFINLVQEAVKEDNQ